MTEDGAPHPRDGRAAASRRRSPTRRSSTTSPGCPAVEQPRICLLPTASGDPDDQIDRFHRAFRGLGRLSHLSLFRLGTHPISPREHLLGQDVIYVGGGSLANLLAIWRVHGLDDTLREAWERGIVLCGVSAGSMCWFEDGVTRSHGRSRRAQGLGLLPGSNSVHHSSDPERRACYRAAVLDGLAPGYAVDDGVGLLFAGTELVEVVSARPDARAHAGSRRQRGDAGGDADRAARCWSRLGGGAHDAPVEIAEFREARGSAGARPVLAPRDVTGGRECIRPGMNEIARRPDEVRGLSDLAFRELADAWAGSARSTARSPQRAFSSTGPAARPVQLVARRDLRRGLRRAARRQRAARPRRRRGAGPACARRGPRAVHHAARQRGARRDQRPDGRRARARGERPPGADGRARGGSGGHARAGPRSTRAFPEATPHLVVFLHGLMETEFAWRLGAARQGGTYASRLAARPGLHAGRGPLQQRPPHLRERPLAGRAARGAGGGVAGGGRADRAGRALDGRPRGPQRLPLRERRRMRAGPGGCGTWSRSAPRTWARRSSRRCTWRAPALSALPEIRPFGAVLRRRSAGIRDLRQGSLVDEDWRDRDPDALRAAAVTEVPLLEGRHALLRGRHDHPQPRGIRSARLLGDALVLEASASGRGARPDASRSRRSTACTSAAPTTWRC